MERLQTEAHRRERRFFFDGRVVGGLGDLRGALALDSEVLPTFLRIGYAPGTATLWKGVDCLPGGADIEVSAGRWVERARRSFATEVDRARWSGMGREALVAEGGRLFQRAVTQAWRGEDPVVPLSGGLDSRAVLGALCEIVPPSRIQTVTWGTPGSLDFELGCAVARAAGTRHLALDLGKVPFSAERLREIAVLTDANTDLFQPVVWLALREAYGVDATFWSGFTGDGIGGSFWSPEGPESAAAGAFLAHESRPIHWLEPSERDDVRDGALADRGLKYAGAMSSDEAFWFENHVERYTAHHLFPVGFSIRAPFMDDDFVRFFLGVPSILRKDKALFDEVVVARYPALFRLPTSGYGYRLARRPFAHAGFRARSLLQRSVARLTRGRLAVHPKVLYLDYADAIRHRPDLRRTVEEALESLSKRDILDAGRIRRIWREHLEGREHRYTLTLLASLEYMLQALVDAR